MSYKIVFSKQAIIDFQKILEYIQFQWGKKSAIFFYSSMLNFQKNLLSNPLMGHGLDSKNKYRQFSITKQSTIIYEIKKQDSEIRILRIFDVRQHPDKKYKNLK